MVTKPMEDWHEANQRYLMAAFGVMRAHLESSGDSSEVEEARGKLEEAAVALPAPSALGTLSNAFGLSGFENDRYSFSARALSSTEHSLRSVLARRERRDTPIQASASPWPDYQTPTGAL